MNTRQRTIVILAIVMSMIISGCGIGQLFEPTVRPTASFTLSGPETTLTETPTPSETPKPTDIPTLIETPTVTQIPFENGPSLEFSPLLPAEWHKEFTGHVEGMDIPIIIGLSDSVVHDKTAPITPISGVWMTQEGTDAVIDAFLRASHYRYTKIMGNTVTYEQYLEILKQPTGGEVNLLIMDNDGVTRREAIIDPRQGVSMLMTDKIDPKLGVKYNREYSGFFGVDGQGRLLLADDFFSKYDLNKEIIVGGVSITNYQFVASSFTPLTIFGYLENKCMASGNSLPCGEAKNPPEAKDWWQLALNKQNEMLANGKFEPFWGLDRP